MSRISARDFMRSRRVPPPLFGIGSTILAGLSNIIVQLLGATILSPTQFGIFAIGAATAIFLLGLGRSVVGQVDLIRGNTDSDDGARGAAYLLGISFLSLGGVLSLSAWLLGFSEFGAFLSVAVGVSISGLLVMQDSLRFRAFREGFPKAAMFSDLAMVLVNAFGVGCLTLTGIRHFSALFCIWGLAIGVGLYVGHKLLNFPFSSPSRGLRWISKNRDLAFTGLGEYVLQSGIPYFVNFLVLGLGGANAFAGLRLIQLIFSPVTNVAVGINSTLVPKLVETKSVRLAGRQGKLQFALSTVLSTSILSFILVLPDSSGTAIFGDNWFAMEPFIVAGAVHGWINALAVPNFSLLRILGFASFSFKVRLISSVLTVILVAFAVLEADPVLVAWGLAVPAILSYLIRVVRVITRLRKFSKQKEEKWLN